MKKVLLASLLAIFSLSTNLALAQCWQTLGHNHDTSRTVYAIDKLNHLYKFPQDYQSGSGFSQLEVVDTTHQWLTLHQGTDTRVNFGLRADKSLWGWGWNYQGCVGVGHKSSVNEPTFVDAGPWESVSFVSTAVTGIKEDGTIWRWGMDTLLTPTQEGTGSDWQQFGLVDWSLFKFGLKDNGDLWGAFWNETMSPLITDSNFVKIYPLLNDINCVREDGSIVIYNINNATLNDYPSNEINEMTHVSNNGTYHFLGIKEDSSLWLYYDGFVQTPKMQVSYNENGDTVQNKWVSAILDEYDKIYAINQEGEIWHDTAKYDHSSMTPFVNQAEHPDCAVPGVLLRINNYGLCEGGFAYPNYLATLNPGGYIVETDYYGRFILDSVPDGTYTMSIDEQSQDLLVHCDLSGSINILDGELVGEPQFVYAEQINICFKPRISLHSNRFRPCVERFIGFNLTVPNNPTGYLPETDVVLSLDSHLTILESNYQYTELGNHQYLFHFTDLQSGSYLYGNIKVMTDCNLQMGVTLCNEIEITTLNDCQITPYTEVENASCSSTFDDSDLDIRLFCEDDSVRVQFTNEGTGDMECASEFYLYRNDSVLLVDEVQLNSQANYSVTFPSLGECFIATVNQHPLHPGNSFPINFIEMCGSDSSQWQVGVRLNHADDDREDYKSQYCALVSNSYDPNAKTGYPLGHGETNMIEKNTSIDFVIDFQNTGNDTAYQVVLRDTLSTNFEIYSVKSGASSHPYTFKRYGQRVLEWTFEDIDLLDSLNNEEESKGFVHFSVDQVPDLPIGTVLNNRVGIYFDYNDPIITNTTLHTIGELEDIPSVGLAKKGQLTSWSFYPNPTSGEITIQLPTNAGGKTYRIWNLEGRVIQAGQLESNKDRIQLNNQKTGMYFIQVEGFEVRKLAFQK